MREPISIDANRNGFRISFGYNKRLVDDIRSTIPGLKFDHSKRIWSAPLKNRRYVELFAGKHNVTISESNDDVDTPEFVGTLPSMPDLVDEIEGLRLPLFPYQRQGVAAGLRFKRFINGDQPGLGKTFASIATIHAANAYPCLVICPAALKENWRREWEKFAGVKALILNDKVKRSWPAYLKTNLFKVAIVNYESLRKYFVNDIDVGPDQAFHSRNIIMKPESFIFKSVIIDEAHRVKDPNAQQTKFTLRLTAGLNGESSPEYVIALTGTPIKNKPKDLLAQLAIIGRTAVFGGYTKFLKRYCEGGSGASNLRELNYLLNKYCFFRREKQAVLKDLPDKMRQVVYCEITTRSEYQKAEKDFIAYLREIKGCTDKEIRRKLRGEVMVKMGELKYISARGKIPGVVDYVRDVLESGEKVVLFCHLSEVGNAILKAFPGAVSIRGGDKDRQTSIDRFQNDPSVMLCVCSLQAAGVGLTLTASSRVQFIEFPWTYADCEQAEDRCHRIGQRDSVQCTYFIGQDTIDEYCYKIIQDKKNIADTITGTTTVIQEDIIEGLFNLFLNSS